MADQEHNNEGAAERPTLASPASAPPPSDTLAAPDGSGDRLSLSGFPVSVEADSAKNTNDFRSLPADPTPAATVPPPLPQLPGFALLDTLGRGGMGVVYKAQQLGLNRLVALKMVLAGAHASAEMLQRFKTEAAAIAQLQHPHIVQVYEIGEQEGLPYFAMEYVGGGSLDKLLAGTPQQPRDAALFVALLADAMELAHSKGIVHRDLKPANILLQRKNEECRMKNESNSSATFDIRHSKLGIPKITDFGLAKSLDADSAQTKSGMIMGTPSYMAPEQAAAKLHLVGPAADVYALGAILYEMLTGRPPFKAATALDTVMQVIHEEAVAPCKLQPRTPKDVETICLKCLRKDPARRYASAAALADDLRAFGEGRPIAARPVSRVERAWRWSKRNPAVAGLLATLACVVTAAFAVVFLLWLNAKEQRDLAQHERQKAEAHAALALHHLRTAEAQSEAARTEAAKSKKVADVMVGMFQAADPFGINGVLFIPKIMGEELTVRELLHRGAERMAKDLKDQPAVQAAVLDAIGQVYVTLGRMPEAAPLLEQAFHLRRQHLGEAHLDTATSRVNLGWLLHQQGEYLKAEQHYRAALALREKLQAAPELVDAARFRLAWLLTEMQEHAEAKQLGEQIIAFRRQHFGEKHRETAIAYLCMAGLYLEAGETAAAVPLSLKAMGIFLEVEGSASLSQAFAAFQNGWFAYNLGNYDKAEKDWRQSLQLLQTAVGAKHPAALLVLHEVGRVCEAKGKDHGPRV